MRFCGSSTPPPATRAISRSLRTWNEALRIPATDDEWRAVSQSRRGPDRDAAALSRVRGFAAPVRADDERLKSRVVIQLRDDEKQVGVRGMDTNGQLE